MQSLPRRSVFLAPLLSAMVALATAAQAPAPAFEVASIRLMPPDSPCCFSMNSYPSNRFSVRDTNLAVVIAIAYGFNQKHIVGEPDWVDSQLWSIDAKVEGDTELSDDQMKPLLQQLLKERFHLAMHRETRSIQGYELVLPKGVGKLSPSAIDEKAHGYILSSGMDFAKSPISSFAAFLEIPIGKPVVDHTGLTGSYDIKLSYAPTNNPNADSTLPDIFTAIQDQLGLKLVPAKVPVDYLVIDHVDRTPTEN